MCNCIHLPDLLDLLSDFVSENHHELFAMIAAENR